MRKIILGASLVATFVAGRLPAQQSPMQAPAPIVPVATTDVMGGGPVYDGGAPIVPLGGGLLETGGTVGGGGSGSRGYVEASFLLMWTSDTTIATPLATGGPSLGIIGRQGTTILSNQNVSYDAQPGFKVAMGQMLGDSRVGFEVAGFYLGEDTQLQTLGRTSASIIARPFFDPTARAENSRVIAAPNAFNGALTIASGSSVFGFEAGPFLRTSDTEAFTLDLIAGFRYMQHQEDLSIYDSSNLLAGGTTAFNGVGLASPSSIIVHDYFSTTNTFYGGQVGAKFGFGRGGLFLDVSGKVAIGAVHQRVNIDGTTVATGGPFPTPAGTAGGFLSSDGLNGVRNEGKFAVLPEGNAQLGYQFTSWLNVFAGYSFTYLSNAARPAEQVTRTINVNGLPTSPTFRRPTSRVQEIVEGDLWFHGFNFGATVTY